MPKYFVASDDLAIETTQNMDPFGKLGNASGMKKGRMKAYVSVCDPGEDAHSSLPTLREFLDKYTDPATGMLSYDLAGQRLSIDPTPLRALPSEYLDCRVSPGASFVTYDGLEIAGRKARTTH